MAEREGGVPRGSSRTLQGDPSIAFLMVFGRKSTETFEPSRRPEHKHEHDHSNKNHDSEHSGSGIIEFQDHLVALVLLGELLGNH